MLKLDITHDCLKFLRTLNPKQFRQVVTAVFNLLHAPEPHDSAALTGYPYRRVDIGEYRIVYRVEGDMLKVPLVGKRNDDEIYKDLRRLRR
ncbi:MAG: type II toxin-antitoxin system RelE/ParE family toxin [Deltaproteobacteria bacterium]|nr:type II toxin-antitoxin system RelE/ParE family toxin [Deltaproteobacteria bacterium]